MMVNDPFKYYLEHYHGFGSRHTCPNCGDANSFALYVDDEGKPLDLSVGRCNHESGCGYHKTPSQFFTEHPEMKPSKERCESKRRIPYFSPLRMQSQTTIQPDTIPQEYVNRSKSLGSSFITFLGKIFDADSVIEVARLYHIGATKAGEVIFWQIDTKGGVRCGKIINYNPQTGHRIKDEGLQVDWVHSRMKRMGLLSDSWNLSQCLFGEHLINADKDNTKTIALVESEKSAIIGALQFPQYIWMATGGIGNLKAEKMKVLRGRTIIIFPDVDGTEKWRERASSIHGCNVIVSDILEKNATPEERASKIDIADWIIASRLKGEVAASYPEQTPQPKRQQESSQPIWNMNGIPYMEHQPSREENEIFEKMMAKSPTLASMVEKYGLEVIGMKPYKKKGAIAPQPIVNNNSKTNYHAI